MVCDGLLLGGKDFHPYSLCGLKWRLLVHACFTPSRTEEADSGIRNHGCFTAMNSFFFLHL
jgi:hypothetical protein